MIIMVKEYYECILPKRNKYAFYELTGGKDLFGYILLRRWGRIGTKGQPILQMRYATQEELLKALSKVRKERLKKQYKVISPGKRKKRASKKKVKKTRRLPKEPTRELIQGRLF